MAESKHIDTLLSYSCNLRILNEPCINRMLLKDESGVSSIWGIHLQYHFRTSKTKNLLNHKSISFIQAPIQAQISTLYIVIWVQIMHVRFAIEVTSFLYKISEVFFKIKIFSIIRKKSLFGRKVTLSNRPYSFYTSSYGSVRIA